VLASHDALASGRLDRDRLERAFEATHTTSPAGAILASIDAARSLLERHGAELLGRLIEMVAAARSRLAQVPGVEVLDGAWIDPTKLVVLLHRSGADGYRVEEALIDQGMPLEMADRDLLIPMVTIADDPAGVESLADTLCAAIAANAGGEERSRQASLMWAIEPDPVMSPRDAFFAPHVTVAADDAVGRVCAELVAPYPPGVPVLAPGERITAEVLDALRAARTAGARIAYAADPSLATVQIVA
jgi:arginine decarboxylase